MQSAYKVLEIERILERLSSFCQSEKGKRKALSLDKLPEAELREELIRLGEANDLIAVNGRFPISPSEDLDKPIGLAKKGGTLSEGDLSGIADDCESMASLRRYLSKASHEGRLAELSDSVEGEEAIAEEVRRVIGPNLEVMDKASTELKRIRSSISRLTRELSSALPALLKKYGPYLSESTFSMREGHYVLPVADTYKNKVKGIVYGISNSGSSTFIEPSELVDKENKIAELGYQEKEEIRRILHEISLKVGDHADNLLRQNDVLSYFDFVEGKVLYGESIHAHMGALSEDGSLFIPEARHPLLEAEKVVPNGFSLSPNRRVLVISGPNAGGKTVALKTIGVSCYLFMMGMMVPSGPGSLIPYFKKILVDIGDSQSIEASLSTFSGHMSGIAEILRLSGGRDLVLLDEIGTGTSPKEGEALATAIVEFLLHKHAYALVSSHFEGLKAFAMSSKFIENACMGIDPDTFTPTYKLMLGIPGESYGLKVAAGLGIPTEVISSAEKKLSEKGEGSVSQAIGKLTRLTKENEALQEELKKQEAKMALREKKLKAEEKDLENRKENYLSDVKSIKEKMLEDAKAEIDEAMEALREPELKQHKLAHAKRKLRDLEEQESRTYYDGPVEEGDYVEIPDYEIEGIVSRKKGKTLFIQTSSGASFQVDENRARRTDAPKEKQEAISGALLDLVGGGSLPLEVNLIGLHVDEAKEELSHYLDQCRLKGFKRVRVIHGFGSGALRKMTQDYLKANSRFVDRFEAAGEFEGGAGATVVYLK